MENTNGSKIIYCPPSDSYCYETLPGALQSIFRVNLPSVRNVVSVISDAHKNPNAQPCYDAVRGTFRDGGFTTFLGNLYVPREGVYVQSNPLVVDGEIKMDRDELVEKIQRGDSNVKFVPNGFKIGALTPDEVAKHPYITAIAEQAGAEELAELARMAKTRVRFWSPEKLKKPEIRGTLLCWGAVDADYMVNYLHNGRCGALFSA